MDSILQVPNNIFTLLNVRAGVFRLTRTLSLDHLFRTKFNVLMTLGCAAYMLLKTFYLVM